MGSIMYLMKLNINTGTDKGYMTTRRRRKKQPKAIEYTQTVAAIKPK